MWIGSVPAQRDHTWFLRSGNAGDTCPATGSQYVFGHHGVFLQNRRYRLGDDALRVFDAAGLDLGESVLEHLPVLGLAIGYGV
jgi:hypothetical protein